MSLFSKLTDLTKAVAEAARSAQDSIAARREQIRAATVARDHAKGAPLPMSDLDRRAQAAVLTAREVWIEHQHQGLVLRLASAAARPTLPRDWHQPVTWQDLSALNPELVVAGLRALAREREYNAGPLEAERAAIVERLTRELAELEAEEERAIDEAEAAGVTIAHRPEVIQRRATENRQQELSRDREEAAKAREAELDAARAVTGHRGPVHSEYLRPKP